MSWKVIRRPLLVAAVVAAVGAASTAAEPRQLRPCPERAATQCEYLPSPPHREERVKPKSIPQQVTDSRGRVVWRYGRWFME
jgi:hypothetical protein